MNLLQLRFRSHPVRIQVHLAGVNQAEVIADYIIGAFGSEIRYMTDKHRMYTP